jgi:hypothetical protein
MQNKHFLKCMCRKTPANIRMQKCCQHARTLQYKLTLAEEELLHDNTVDSNEPVPATQPLSQQMLLFQDPQDQPPQDPPPPHAARRLALEAMEMQQAVDYLPQRSPSRERTANIVDSAEEVQVPASPIIYCSQYKMEE